MNPLSLSAYVLSTNNDGKLTTANAAVKQNLKTYLSQYKMLTDAVTIKNAFYVNIGINFEIQVLQGFNAQQVLIGCINALKEFFNTASPCGFVTQKSISKSNSCISSTEYTLSHGSKLQLYP